MKTTPTPLGLTAVVALVTALGLSACNRAEEDRTVGQRVDSAVASAGEQADRAQERVAEAAADAKEAVSDATITAKINAELARDSELSALRIDVDTSEGRVALKGSAPTRSARERAAMLASAVEGVRSVDNQLIVTNT